MVDVERDCGQNGCLVLATEMTGLSCDDYCFRSGRQCLAAWEEWDDTCNSKLILRCDQVYGTTSDLLCRCSDQLVGLETRAQDIWEIVWSDEFDGSEVDRSKWGFVTGGGGFGNQELQHYTDRTENARVADGVLHITAQCEQYDHEHYTSAKLTTEETVEWGPGHRVEVRAKMPSGKGTWPAIWMLPTDSSYGDWPKSGEIDIMEAVGCTEGKIYGTVHTDAYNHMKSSQAYNSASLAVTDWHTYAIEWKDNGIQWFVDGELFSSFAPSSHSSDKWPFDKEFFLILNLAVGGSWGGYCVHGSPSCYSNDAFAQPQVMEVDYARVYRLKA
jgi:beta-glucanase (GH16 family)